ncbi:hypothetical protein KSS87_013567 [Heliosperma pusillum]|nr:hypothetical protein KSS87_013567 [Heliosperma pusillum]
MGEERRIDGGSGRGEAAGLCGSGWDALVGGFWPTWGRRNKMENEYVEMTGYNGHSEQLEFQAATLYDAALVGNVSLLINLLQKDPLILDRLSIKKHGNFTQTPLHVSANLGHWEFTREILSRKPELAEELDHSKRWSPLHMASAKGHLENVKILVAVNPKMCLVRDLEGRNPVHMAAINGQVHVLHELVRVVPQAARGRTSSGETVLHLCVTHGEAEALRFLVNELDDGVLLNTRNSDGDTVLQLAVAAKQVEVTKFLTKNKRMNVNAINENGLTAMDTLAQSKKDSNGGLIYGALRQARAMKAKEALEPQHKQKQRLDDHRNGLMVAASLIATMAFTVGITPPGGTWQDNDGHVAGTGIMANSITKQSYNSTLTLFPSMYYTGVKEYEGLLLVNTIGLVSSLSVILLLISGLPCKRLFVGMLMVIMWIAVTATAMSYAIAVTFIVSAEADRPISEAILIAVVVWVMLMIVLLLGHSLRFIYWLARKLLKVTKELLRT